MALSTHLLIVTATILPAAEQAWNTWYNEIHLPEIVECPGFTSAQRYVAQAKDGSQRYVSIYELADESALETQEFAARRGWDRFVDDVKFETLRYSRIAQIVRD